MTRFPSILLLLLLLLLAPRFPADSAPAPNLKVSKDGHSLETTDGKPFFYLADTAWELFHRPSKHEAGLYLDHRATNGFSVIQAVVLAELDGLQEINFYGDRPLQDLDPEQPNEAYFNHVDELIAEANRRGLVMAVLPTWGDKWNNRWGLGPEIFTPENARNYGKILGRRLKDRQLIWVLGGDRIPEKEEHFEIIREMAAGLASGDEGRHLMTFHPMGGRNSAEFFHEDEWLDFNMFQSGHQKLHLPNYLTTLANRNLKPVKPTLDGEACYEEHPIGWKSANGWFDASDVRRAAWRSLLAGACGHTYGHHSVWQFWEQGRKPVSEAKTPWERALDAPGALQMKYLRHLLESLGWPDLKPAQDLILGENPEDLLHVQAATLAQGERAVFHIPEGRPIRLDLKGLGKSREFRAWWIDPRDGSSRAVDPFLGQDEGNTFQPPAQGRILDWVLVVTSAGDTWAPKPIPTPKAEEPQP